MKTAALAAVLGIAMIAATGCDREPTSPTAYNNSGATAAGTTPTMPAPAAPNIQPATGDLAIPDTVPSEPKVDPAAPTTSATAGTTTTPAVPDTVSPAAPPASSLPAQPAAPTTPAADAAKPAEAPSQAPR